MSMKLSEVESMPDLLTYTDISLIFKTSYITVRKNWKAGKFPAPIDVFGPKFRKQDVIAYMKGEWRPSSNS